MAKQDDQRTAALEADLAECDEQLARWRTKRAVTKALASCGGVVPSEGDEEGFTEWAPCLRTELAAPGAAKPAAEGEADLGKPLQVVE